MRVLHVIPTFRRDDGGPTLALADIAKVLSARGVEVEIATTARGEEADRMAAAPGARVTTFSRWPGPYKISWRLTTWLWRNVRSFDLIHVHSLFNFPAVGALLIARLRGARYIVRPLGTLSEWGVERNHPVLKKISLALFERRLLKRAAALHFTSVAERDEAARYVTTASARIVPLGVDAPESIPERTRSGALQLLFLSRIHPKKGLEHLLDALPLLRDRGIEAPLVVAGSGDRAYEERLRKRADELGIAASVTWAGFVSGRAKAELFASAHVFVLPSYSENFGLSVAEALSYGVPVIVTSEVALSREVAEARAGFVVDRSAQALADAVADLATNKALLEEMSSAARMLGERFSLDNEADAMTTMYDDVVEEEMSR